VETATTTAGTSVPVEVTVSAVSGETRPVGAVGIVREIADLETVREKLSQERARASQLFENLQDPALEMQVRSGTVGRSTVQTVDPAFAAAFDVDRQRVVGEPLSSVFDVDTVDGVDPVERIERASRERQTVSFEIRQPTGDVVRDFVFQGVPHRDTDDASRVVVHLRRERDDVVVRVSDDGPGIPAHERAVVTGDREPTQLDHESGLDLWTTRRIVEKYGGTVEFETPGEPTPEDDIVPGGDRQESHDGDAGDERVPTSGTTVVSRLSSVQSLRGTALDQRGCVGGGQHHDVLGGEVVLSVVDTEDLAYVTGDPHRHPVGRRVPHACCAPALPPGRAARVDRGLRRRPPVVVSRALVDGAGRRVRRRPGRVGSVVDQVSVGALAGLAGFDDVRTRRSLHGGRRFVAGFCIVAHQVCRGDVVAVAVARLRSRGLVRRRVRRLSVALDVVSGRRGVRVGVDGVENGVLRGAYPVHEVVKQRPFLGGEAVLVDGHVGGGERGALDELAEPALVHRLDDLLGGVDLVGETAHVGAGERVLGLGGGAVAAPFQVGDVLAGLLVERLPQRLEVAALAFGLPDGAQFFQIHPCATISARPRQARNTPTYSGTY